MCKKTFLDNYTNINMNVQWTRFSKLKAWDNPRWVDMPLKLINQSMAYFKTISSVFILPALEEVIFWNVFISTNKFFDNTGFFFFILNFFFTGEIFFFFCDWFLCWQLMNIYSQKCSRGTYIYLRYMLGRRYTCMYTGVGNGRKKNEK